MVHLLASASAALLLLVCLIGAVATVWSFRTTIRGSARLGVSALALLFIGALWVRLWLLTPHHLMYVDEPWYLEAARNLVARHGLVLCEETRSGLECRPYEKAVGWPVLLAGVFALSGPSAAAAFVTSAVLGALCVPLVAIAVLLGRGTWYHAALAGVVLAAHPLHALWSVTAETNAAATAFMLAGLVGAVVFVRDPGWASALLSGGGFGSAAAMRPELSLAAIPALVWIATTRRGDLSQRLTIAGAAAIGMLSVPLTWGLYVSNSGGPFLAIDNIRANCVQIVSDPKGGHLTLAIVLAACVGAAATVRRGAHDVAAFLGGAAALIALAVLAYDPRIFYARNLLGATVALVPLAALALPLRWPALGCSVAGAAAVFLASSSWPAVSSLTETQQLENALPARIAALTLPADALVLAEWPTIVRASADIPTMATSRALGQLEEILSQRPVFLFCDMFCEPSFSGSGESACRQVLDRFALDEVTAAELHGRRYGLYRIRQRRAGDAASPPCPLVAR